MPARGILASAVAIVIGLSTLGASAEDKPAALSDYAIASWGLRDGLPSNVIWAIAQDPQGYLWLGTDGGLVRFDGARFVVVTAIGTTALPKARVVALHVTRSGSLWVGFHGGASRIDRHELVNYGDRDGLPTSIVRGIVEDADGTIYIANGEGLFQLAGNQWHKVAAEQGLPPGAVDSTYITRAGDFIVGTIAGVFRADRGTKRFQLVDAVEGGAAALRGFSEDQSGQVWVTDSQIGFRKLGDPRPAGISKRARGWQLLHDAADGLWLATAGEELWRIRGLSSRKMSIETARVLGSRSVYEDRDGNIWTGSSEGLIRLTKPRVTPITGLGTVAALQATPDGHVWASAGDELVRFSATSDGWKAERTRVDSDIRGLATDPGGTLWAMTTSRLARFDHPPATYFSPDSGRALARMNGLAADARGRFWISDVDHGLFRWNPERGGTLEPANLPDGLRISAMTTDRSGRLWFSSTSGLLGLIDHEGKVRTYGREDGLRSGPYVGVYEDRSQTIWVGDGDGLTRLVNGRFARVTDEGGFRGFVTGITEDDAGDLWLATFAGIACIRRGEIKETDANGSATAHFSFYDASDGAAGLPVPAGRSPITKAADGTLWFITSRGLTIVNPTTLKSDRAETPVRIEEITADDRGVEITPKAVLSAGTNRLQIGYSAIELTSVEKVRFRYRLDGFDAAWIEAGRQRQAVYTQLPARSYRFVVQATNHDGSWSEPGAVWQFAITPMFYETAWFATVVITSLALIGWATWRFHIRRVRQQFALVLSERVRMSRELHDTLLQSLVGVAVQVGTVADALESSSPARQQIIRIRERVEEYIRDARQSIWNLRAPVLASRDLSSSLRCVGERAIGERPIALEIATVGEPVKYASEVEEQLLRIGQEAILNAALHADPTRIHIALQYSDDSLRLSVSDDGGGFDVAHAFANADGHYGLITMKERAEAAGGRLDISSTPSTGTSVVVAVRYSPPDLE